MLEMPRLAKREPLNRIAFYGPMCSGKTWCADYVVKYNHYKKVAFADRLKALAYELFGVQSKEGIDRQVLQDLGQKLREIDPDVWIKRLIYQVEYLESLYKQTTNTFPPIVLDDLRYVNEAKALKLNGFTLIRVECPDEVRAERISKLYPNTSNEVKSHASEREWQLIKPDYVVTSLDYDAAFSIQKILAEKIKEFSRSG